MFLSKFCENCLNNHFPLSNKRNYISKVLNRTMHPHFTMQCRIYATKNETFSTWHNLFKVLTF